MFREAGIFLRSGKYTCCFMEVHHHAHTARKKWSHYLWEFLMLFLAVYCGFLAENWREHRVEHLREIQFIKSYIEDLKIDTTNISNNLVLRTNKIKELDSLILFINDVDPNKHSGMIYFWARRLTRTNRFLSADRTIKQLKNAGGLRLIKSQIASDSILNYDEAINRFYYYQDRQTNEILTVSALIGKLFNANVFETMITGQTILPPKGNPAMRSVNKDLILDFIYDVHQLKTSDVFLIVSLNNLKQRAVNTIKTLKKEYHLK
jgi:hypothetical protein